MNGHDTTTHPAPAHGARSGEGTAGRALERARPSVARRAGHFLARSLFPPEAPRSRPLRRAVLRSVLVALADALDSTPMARKLWLMGGLAIGYARTGRPLDNDLTDVDLGYADVDHDAMMASLPILAAHGFFVVHRLESNAGIQTVMRLRRDGVWIDVVRCFRRADREYWVTYAMDPSREVPRELEVETEVSFQRKVPTAPPVCGATWLRAADLSTYLSEQYGDAWRAPDDIFYARQWDHVRDSPAVVRVEPWRGTW